MLTIQNGVERLTSLFGDPLYNLLARLDVAAFYEAAGFSIESTIYLFILSLIAPDCKLATEVWALLAHINYSLTCEPGTHGYIEPRFFKVLVDILVYLAFVRLSHGLSLSINLRLSYCMSVSVSLSI